MRKKIVAGNWKLNNGAPKAARDLAVGVLAECRTETAVDVVLCPPFTAISAVVEVVKGTPVSCGAQNVYPKDSGAYTGEIDPNSLLDLGCRYVIIGHSERRQYFKETDEFINEKVKAVLAKGMTPILCCGETLQERQENKTESVVKKHVTGGLSGLSADDTRKVVIAYEPVWAIGTGMTATPQQAQDVHAFIRATLKQMHNADLAQAVRIQYGGSVKADNARELFSQPDIDGGLIGGASLKVADFVAIVRAGR